MFTNEELERLLNDIESDRVERTIATTDKAKIAEAICSFANDMPNHRLPGILFIGARPDGTPSGVTITDALLQSYADYRSNGNIYPMPSLSVEKRTLRGGEMAVVVVYPSEYPPVRFDGRACIRVGPSRRIANTQEEARLAEKRLHHNIPFDIRPETGTSIQILDDLLFTREYLPRAVAKETIAANHRTIEEQLTSLRMAHPGHPAVPTKLGILVLGKNPTEFIPGAYIQFVRFGGTELADDILDQKRITGPLIQINRDVEDILRVNIVTPIDITSGPTEQRFPNYPLAALQQLVRNALIHRTYETSNAPIRIYWFSDRIEIQNPGGPYGQVTKENFGNPGITDYRNPSLAEAMRILGYVQRFGAGIQTARRELAANENPPPEFQIENEYVGVIVRKRP